MGTTGSAAPRLSRMVAADIPAVSAIERAAFGSGWSPTAFERELTNNPVARYLVLRHSGAILGFAGLWLMVDEAHVVTVAVSPEHRRLGYGRVLVYGLVEIARAERMADATLECRVSNFAARRLYALYGFYEVGVRPRYYADNNEDAVIMTTEELHSPAYGARLAALKQWLEAAWPGIDVRLEGSSAS